jgi:hypothetical protein
MAEAFAKLRTESAISFDGELVLIDTTCFMYACSLKEV